MKQINIKNRTYYFFDDMINIKDSSLIKVDKKSYKSIGIIILDKILRFSDLFLKNKVDTIHKFS